MPLRAAIDGPHKDPFALLEELVGQLGIALLGRDSHGERHQADAPPDRVVRPSDRRGRRKVKGLLAAGDRDLETLRQWAREDGLVREFRELERPQPWVAPQWEPKKRVLVVKKYCVTGPTPYGEDIFQAEAGAVIDLELSIIEKVGDSVEIVAADMPLRHVPVTPMQPTH